MAERTDRFRFPLLVYGQAQKDVTHNEALLAFDSVLHPVLESRALATPPAEPDIGRSWLVAVAGAAGWAGCDGKIATWTSGGWRFQHPPAGFVAWLESESLWIRKTGDGWVEELAIRGAAAAVQLPVGGATVDAEARTAIAEILARLQDLQLLED